MGKNKKKKGKGKGTGGETGEKGTMALEVLNCQILYTLVAVSSYATIHYYYIVIVRIDLQYTCYLVPVLKIHITSIFVYSPYL